MHASAVAADWRAGHLRGVAKGGPGGPGTPNPIPLKLLRIKRVRTRHALRIRLIKL